MYEIFEKQTQKIELERIDEETCKKIYAGDRTIIYLIIYNAFLEVWNYFICKSMLFFILNRRLVNCRSPPIA